MSHPYIQAALARERQNMLLAEAEAVRRARQARSHRRRRGTPTTRRSPSRRIPDWLLATWTRLLTSQPGSRSETTGRRAELYNGSAVAGREVRRADAAPAAAERTALGSSPVDGYEESLTRQGSWTCKVDSPA